MNSYIILPQCDDQNRGDQALVWETVDLAQKAGFKGKFYMLGSKELSPQSMDRKINVFSPILKHPSRFYRTNKNINFNFILKLKWGFVSIFDFIYSFLFLLPVVKEIILFFSSSDVKKSFNLIKNSNCVFVKGGGIFHSYGGIVVLYQLYYALYHIILALTLKKKIYIMPNSFGPFKGPFVKALFKYVLSKCTYITVRESLSFIHLKNIQIDSKKFSDLAFFLPPSGNLKIDKLLYSLKNYKSDQLVAITVRPYRFPDSKDPIKLYNKYKESIVNFIFWLQKNNYYPVLIEHTYNRNEHEQDIKCINEIIEKLNNSKFGLISDRTLNCQELKELYSRFGYVVGTRFHSVIFSLSTYVPSMAISYGGNKGEGIMNDIGLQDLCLSINSISFEKIINKFIYMKDNKKEILNKLHNYSIYLNKAEKQIIKDLNSFINLNNQIT